MKLPKYILLVWAPLFAVLTITLFSIFVSLFDRRHLQYPFSLCLYLSLTDVAYNIPLQYFCIYLWRMSPTIPLFSIFASLFEGCHLQYLSSVFFCISLWRMSYTIPLFSIFVSLCDGRHSATVCTQFAVLALPLNKDTLFKRADRSIFYKVAFHFFQFNRGLHDGWRQLQALQPHRHGEQRLASTTDDLRGVFSMNYHFLLLVFSAALAIIRF